VYIFFTTEFHKVYTLFDYDENGTISTNQLGTVMRALGVNPSDSEVQDSSIANSHFCGFGWGNAYVDWKGYSKR
jgi:Ca2+-binding EF-hand superfamily protein